MGDDRPQLDPPVPGTWVGPDTPPVLAPSARVVGSVQLGSGALLAQGAVVRARAGAVVIEGASALLENGVIVGTPELPVRIGAKTVFGHRVVLVGATVGDLCEIGNGSIVGPGASIGDRCFLGEGALVPPGAVVAAGSVVVGRPGRAIRQADADDEARLRGLRGGDLGIEDGLRATTPVAGTDGGAMGTTYEYRGTWPTIDPSAVLFDSAEVTGDVHIGARTVIGAGVRIIGDAHGPVRIGADVQILENTVLHLLPDNELVIEDGVVVGPGAMIHGCRLGAGSVVGPAAIVADGAVLGAGSELAIGSLVPQRAVHPAGAVLEGFPAKVVGSRTDPPPRPDWAFDPDDLPGGAA